MWILVGFLLLLAQAKQSWKSPSLSDGMDLFFPKDRVYVQHGDIDGYRASLDKNDIHRRDELEHVMFGAIRTNNLAVISFLLEASGEDFQFITNVNGMTLFHLAVDKGRYDIVQLFLDSIKQRQISNAILNTPRKDFTCRTPLDIAIMNRDTVMFRTLLEAGADPNLNDKQGSSLHLAASDGNLEMIQMLIDAGADPNFKNFDGETPLFHTNREDVIQYLLDSGANLNVCDNRKYTLLYRAILERMDLSVVQKYLDLGLDVNCGSPGDTTPLHIEAMFNDPIRIRFLVKAGADMEAVDSLSRTAITIASENNNAEVVQELIALGSPPERLNWLPRNNAHKPLGTRRIDVYEV